MVVSDLIFLQCYYELLRNIESEPENRLINSEVRVIVMEMERIFKENLVEISRIKINDLEFIGVKMELEGAPLIVLKEKKTGLIIACGYINHETMEKLRNKACIVTGVKTFEDVFKAEIKHLTSGASELGIKSGMTVLEALKSL
jgi:uncharacterized protein YunC (DUF1805 family)